jgi:phosphomannomutase
MPKISALVLPKLIKTHPGSLSLPGKRLNPPPFLPFVPKQLSMDIFGSGPMCKVEVRFDIAKVQKIKETLQAATAGLRTKNLDDGSIEALALGAADYVLKMAIKQGKKPIMVIAGDTRDITRHTIEIASKIARDKGIEVKLLDKKGTASPIIAFETKQAEAQLGLLLTPSHNPWVYGGFNFVTGHAAIADSKVTDEIVANAFKYAQKGSYNKTVAGEGKLIDLYSYDNYIKYINSLKGVDKTRKTVPIIDWEKIAEANISIHYDGMHGAGENVFPELFKRQGVPVNIVRNTPVGRAKMLAEGKNALTESNERFIDKYCPNPVKDNITELANAVKKDKKAIKIGLANDGDADRNGIIDELGNFLTANDVLLLAAYHLTKNKGKTGAVIINHGTTGQIKEMLAANNTEASVIETPIGFKYLGKAMEILEAKGKPVIITGEASGGFTIGGHIPEKDGILALSLILDLIASEKTPLSKILNKIKNSTKHVFEIDEKTIKLEGDNTIKQKVMDKAESLYENIEKGGTVQFMEGRYTVDNSATINARQQMQKMKSGGDGVKLIFTDGSSLLVRPSGTEPKLRGTIEALALKSEGQEIAKIKSQELASIFEKEIAAVH